MGTPAPDEPPHDEETPWFAAWDESGLPMSDERFPPASGFSQGTHEHNITAHNKNAAHIHHEANVEQIFSLAGRISDPNLDPINLERLVRIHFNKKAFMPTIKEIRERYFLHYRKVNETKKQGPENCDDLVEIFPAESDEEMHDD